MKQTANTLPDDIFELKQTVLCLQNSLQKYEEIIKESQEDFRKKLQEKETELQKKQVELGYAKEMIKLLNHRLFGRKSEARCKHADPNQLSIFNEAEELSLLAENTPTSDEAATVEVKSYKRRGKPKRLAIPDSFPREVVVIDLADRDKFCPEGHALKEIGEDASEQLDIIPAKIKVIRIIRKKYACPCCEGHVRRAPLPKTAIPKSLAGAGLLAYIATSKYGDGLPLYRQEHMWQRLGVNIPRATMAGWMIKVGELLSPVLNLMEEDILESGYVQVDETRVQVLKEDGKPADSKSYMWVRSSSINSLHSREDHGVKIATIFEYDPRRSGEVAKRLFADYKGYLQADGYSGYNEVCSREGIIRVGCMAHCRRKFFEATKTSAKGIGLANEAIGMIRKLYEIEETIKEKEIEDRYRIRQSESKPLLDDFKKWLDDNLEKVPPQSQLGNALHYAHNEWPYLVRYIENGRLNIDNNLVENAIRPFAVGRKNWLFSDSVAGAKASAAIYSVMVSARQNGHNEYLYFRYLLEKLPLAERLEEFEALLPHRLSPQIIPVPPHS